MAQRYPAQLSGGQQQRVGVARALAADPPILLMDEPFSAVDPVVRESLQDELLRLQSELGKTIVFVTHDIDEAVKLGDKVAVLRVGGMLAQYDEPGELLARPADDFVDGFVGRDRGYRGLGFLSSDAIPLGELPTVAVGDPVPGDGEWVLVVDAERRPQGWLGPADADERATARSSSRPPGARRLALRPGLRLAAQRARRGAVLAVRAGGGGRRRGPGGRRGQRRRRAARCSTTRAATATTRPRPEGRTDVVWDWIPRNAELIVGLLGEHLVLALLPVLVGLVLAVPLGWLANRSPAARAVLIPSAGLLYTIPSLALFVVLPGHPGHPDPGPAQRDRRADHLHGGAAGPHGRRRAGRGARDGGRPRPPRWASGRRAGSSRSSCRCRSRC